MDAYKFHHLPDAARQAVKTFNFLIEQFMLLKDEAVAEQNFVRAAQIRDQQDKLTRTRGRFIQLWPKRIEGEHEE
jgi:hypothetical protein